MAMNSGEQARSLATTWAYAARFLPFDRPNPARVHCGNNASSEGKRRHFPYGLMFPTTNCLAYVWKHLHQAMPQRFLAGTFVWLKQHKQMFG